MSPEPRTRTGTQAVERALAILAVLETGPDTVSLSDLAEQAGLSPSTAHRIVRALCDAAILRQDLGTERYGLGPRLVGLGQRAGEALGLTEARAVLEALADSTGESVNLGRRDADEVVVVMGVSSSQRLRFDQAAGSHIPAHASAMGKALLAFAPDFDDVVASLPEPERLTGSTITSRDDLIRSLEEVRARGWALNDEEREPGVRSLAAPVLGPGGTARAAVAVQGPAVRMTDARINALAPEVQRAAAAVAPLIVDL